MIHLYRKKKVQRTFSLVQFISFPFLSICSATLQKKFSNNKKQIVVRANAQVGLNALDDPIPYQNFFNALGQSLFLEAHEVE